MAAIIKVTTDGKPQGPLAEKELGYDEVTNELYIGSGNGTGDGTKLSSKSNEIKITVTAELDMAETLNLTGAI